MSKWILSYCLTFFIGSIGPEVCRAQEIQMTASAKENTVKRIADLLNQHYVFPEVANKINVHLKSKFESGYFDAHADYKVFAEALTTDVQTIANDKHLRIRPVPTGNAPTRGQEQLIENRLLDLEQARANTGGFAAV